MRTIDGGLEEGMVECMSSRGKVSSGFGNIRMISLICSCSILIFAANITMCQSAPLRHI